MASELSRRALQWKEQFEANFVETCEVAHLFTLMVQSSLYRSILPSRNVDK